MLYFLSTHMQIVLFAHDSKYFLLNLTDQSVYIFCIAETVI